MCNLNIEHKFTGGYDYNPGNYEKYMSKNPLKKIMVQKLNEKILDAVKSLSQSNDKILDAGCGEGFISSILHANLKTAVVTGLEITHEAVLKARELNPDIEFLQGSVYEVPFDDESFDISVCTEVLEHLESPEKAIKELLRVSRKAVIFTVPNEPWFCMGNLLSLKNVYRLGNPIDHIQHWTYNQFVKYMRPLVSGRWEMVSARSFPWTMVIVRKYEQ